MIQIPNMVMIGAAGRNAGKTELACRLIKKFAPACPVIALKVSTLEAAADKRNAGAGEHGVPPGRGYILTAEERENPGKDTGRMLSAGAHTVYWLRGERDMLRPGLEEFLKLVANGPDKIIVCESNSLRLVVKPGLFIVNQNSRDESVKPSCREVLCFLDQLIRFDREKFAFDIDAADINYTNGRWSVRENAAAIILAGGKSSRMGRDKSLLLAAEITLIEKIALQLRDNFQAILVGANEPEKYGFLNLPVIPDREEGKGPLMGIYSTLRQSQHEINFVVACDIPDLDIQYVREMVRQARNHQIVLPRWSDGRVEPLFAVYRRSVLDQIKKLLDAGERKVRLLFPAVDVQYLPLPDEGRWYRNLNTPGDYDNYIKNYGQGGRKT